MILRVVLHPPLFLLVGNDIHDQRNCTFPAVVPPPVNYATFLEGGVTLTAALILACRYDDPTSH